MNYIKNMSINIINNLATSSFHIYSPLIYILFVKLIRNVDSCPFSLIMKKTRQIHNIFLSLLSFAMLVGVTYSTFESNKFKDLNSLICKPFNGNIANITMKTFLYSKYLEWGDTLFIHLSGKPITMLQYTHHMSTAFLMHVNFMDYISPASCIPVGLNCLVHIPMYWYFAFPKGIIYPFRKMITQIQIIQHIISLLTIIYSYYVDDCNQNKYGISVSLLLYTMYLVYFCGFYLSNYYHFKKG